MQKVADAKEDVSSVIAHSNIKEASEKLKDALKGNLPEAKKFEIIQAFKERFKEQALDFLFNYILSLYSFQYSDLNKLQKQTPNEYGRVRALAYGLALFGDDGFKKCVELVKRIGKMNIEKTNKTPLAVDIAGMAFESMKNKNNTNLGVAAAQLEREIKDPDNSDLSTLVFFTSLIKGIDKQRLCAIVPTIVPELNRNVAKVGCNR